MDCVKLLSFEDAIDEMRKAIADKKNTTDDLFAVQASVTKRLSIERDDFAAIGTERSLSNMVEVANAIRCIAEIQENGVGANLEDTKITRKQFFDSPNIFGGKPYAVFRKPNGERIKAYAANLYDRHNLERNK